MKGKELLNKPNQLMSLKTDRKITALQKKAYNIFLKNAQNLIKFNNYEEVLFKIECKELHEKAGIGVKDDNYLKEEIENLMKTVVSIIDKDNPTDWEMFPLVRYAKRKGEYYYYKLDEIIIDALKHQTFFTPLNLMIIKSLSSQYSITLYELAIRFQKLKIPEMTIEEIRELTNTEDLYNRFFDFKKRVLDTACNEISEKTDIKLSYKTRRRGRNIGYINFKIERKEENFKTTKEKEDSIELIELFNLCKTKTDEIKKILYKSLIKFNYEYVKSNVLYTNKNSKENYTLYLKNSLKNDYSLEDREKEIKKEEQKQKVKQETKDENEYERQIIELKKKLVLEKIKNLTTEERDKHYQAYINNKFYKKDIVSFEDYLEQEL